MYVYVYICINIYVYICINICMYLYRYIDIYKLCMSCTKMSIYISKTQKQDIFLRSYISVSSKPSKN